VENSEDDDPLGFGYKEYPVGETPEEGPTNGLVNERVLIGITGDTLQTGVNRHQEFASEPGNAILMPIKGIGHLGLRLRPDEDRPAHGRFLMRFSTTAQGAPLPGVRR